jgi:hypothetical protein
MRTRLLAFLLLSASISAQAQGTQLWKQSSYDSFEQGTPQGVAIRSDGVLEAAPIAGEVLTTAASAIWSAAADAHGNVYLGTGSPAMVLKVSPDGKSIPLLKTPDISVQAVRIGPDGMIYAATLPNGKVYRLNPNGPEITVNAGTKSVAPAGAVVFDSSAVTDKPNYIWDLAFDRAGRLYIATGGPARIYRVDLKKPAAQPETFFSSSEQHIRAMVFAPDGTLYAGTDGRGLVYRIDKNGKGFVLFEAPNPEISALALDPAGNLYLAALGDKGRSSLPPVTVSSGNVATIRIVLPGSISASTDSTLIPNGTTIYQLSPDGAPQQLWTSKHDVVYALGWQQNSNPAQSGLLAATGNLGHVYRIGTDGTYADLAHLGAKQATALTLASGTFYAATSNPGKLYRFAPPSQKTFGDSVYTSAVHDAKFFSQWGQVETRGSGSYDLFARTGNIEQPQEGWSDWQKIVPGTVAASLPKARFLQWKAVFHPGATLDEIGFYSLPQNVAPVVDDIVVQLHARVTPGLNPDPRSQPLQITLPAPASDSVTVSQTEAATTLMATRARDWATVRWSAHDDNGDQLIYSVYFRGDGEANWHPLRKHILDSYLSFDLGRIPDGGYTLRVVASDAGSRPAADALTGYKDSDHFLLDTTPPMLSALQASQHANSLHVAFDATTKLSTIARAYYSVDAGPWQYVEPAGHISDGLHEHYDFTVPIPAPVNATTMPPEVRPTAPQQHVIAVRVIDRAGNAATAKAVVE